MYEPHDPLSAEVARSVRLIYCVRMLAVANWDYFQMDSCLLAEEQQKKMAAFFGYATV